MKLWRVLALSAATCAASAVHAAEEATASANSELSGNDSGFLSFITQELTRSTALVQRFFFDDGEEQDVAPGATLQLVIVEEGEGDDALEGFFFSSQENDEGLVDLTRQEQQLACLTALKVLHEQDDSKQERKQLSQRLRSPFKRAFQAMSLHFLDEASCDDLDDSRLVDECNRVVDMEDAVRQFMTRGRSDEQVCTLVYREEQVAEPKQVEGELSCKLCKRFVQMVDQALAQEVSQVQQVREIIGDICDSMAADSMCHTFLNQYDQIVNWLKQGMEPSAVCLRITMCVADKKNKLEQLSDLTTIALVQGGDQDHACSYCVHITYVVGKVNEIVPSQLSNVRQLIKWSCKLSPKDCKCDLLVANYDKIIGWVKQDKTPRQICEALNICKKTNSPFAIGSPDESIEDALTALAPLVQSESSQDDRTCFYCDYATTLIQIIMQEDADQVDEIREYADMICGFLGPDNMCHQYIDKLDSVIDQLKKGKHPRDICASMKYCGAKANTLTASTQTTSSAFTVISQDEKVQVGGHDPACSYCVRVAYFVSKVNEYAPSQLDSLLPLLQWGCNLVPQDSTCPFLVANYDKIVGWVKQDKTPRQICEALNVCKKTNSPFAIGNPGDVIEDALTALVPFPQSESSQDDRTCFYCDYATTLIQIIMQEDADQVDEIREYADMICGFLGPDNMCHQYIDKLDSVIDQLKKGKHPRDICASMKYCGAKANTLTASTQTTSSAFTVISQDEKTCLYCDYIAIAMQVILQEDADQVNEIREYADMICGFLGPDNVCHQYVDKLDAMIDQLKLGKHPRDICVGLKYCTSKSKAIPKPVLNAMAAFVSNSRAVDVQDDKKCFYCDYIATLIQIIMQEDAEQVDEIREYADMICGFLGPDNICHQYVDRLDIVIDQLKKGKHPRDICISLKYCTASTKALPTTAHGIEDLAAFDQHLVKVVKNSMESAIDGCFVCTQLASILEVALAEDPSQIDQIRQIGDMVCGFLPSESKCRPVMDELDKVIDALKKGEKPKQICHDMKFCKATANKVEAKEIASSPLSTGKGNNSCTYCSGVVTVLEFALTQKPDEVQEAREAAGIVCELLPSDDKCHTDLKMFDTAVAWLKNGKQPHEICQALKFCSSTDEATSVKLSDLKFLDPSLAPSRCTICKQNTLLLASMSSKPASLATFNEEMNSICRLIPDSKECELLMKHHDTIVDALKNNEDVDSICTRIHECENTNQVAKPAELEKSMSMGCLLCEYTAEMVSHASKNQNELRLAKVALETMCSILPPAAQCDVLSSKFDDLVVLVDAGKSPSQACHSVALCDAAFVEESKTAETVERPDYLLPTEFTPISMGEVMELE